jgi:hypothetical protein
MHAKAWLRRGALRHAAGRVEDGAADLRRAAELEPACAAAVAAVASTPRQKRATAPMVGPAVARGADTRPAALPPTLTPGGALPYAAPGVVCAARRGAGVSEDGAATRLGLRSVSSRAAGDVLLVEPPFAAVLLRTARGACCHVCFIKLPPDSVPCGGCAAARFCSAACATAAAAGPHARECGGAAWPAVLTPEAVLAARVAARIADEEAAATADENLDEDDDADNEAGANADGVAVMTPEAADGASAPALVAADVAVPPEAAGGARAVCALLRRWASLPGEERLECALLSALLAALLACSSSDGAVVTPGGALRALLAVRCSALPITDDWEPAAQAGGTGAARVATALFVTASLAERAAAQRGTSNVMRTAFAPGGVLVLRAAAALPAGAALLLADGSAASPTAKPPASRGSPKAGSGAPAASRKASVSQGGGAAATSAAVGIAAHPFGCVCDTCVTPPSPSAARRAARLHGSTAAAPLSSSVVAVSSPRRGGAAARKDDAGWCSSITVPPRSGSTAPREPAPVPQRPSRSRNAAAPRPAPRPPAEEGAEEEPAVAEERHAREKRLADAEHALAALLQAASAARSAAASVAAAAAKAKTEAQAAEASASATTARNATDGTEEKPSAPARMAGASA